MDSEERFQRGKWAICQTVKILLREYMIRNNWRIVDSDDVHEFFIQGYSGKYRVRITPVDE